MTTSWSKLSTLDKQWRPSLLQSKMSTVCLQEPQLFMMIQSIHRWDVPDSARGHGRDYQRPEKAATCDLHFPFKIPLTNWTLCILMSPVSNTSNQLFPWDGYHYNHADGGNTVNGSVSKSASCRSVYTDYFICYLFCQILSRKSLPSASRKGCASQINSADGSNSGRRCRPTMRSEALPGRILLWLNLCRNTLSILERYDWRKKNGLPPNCPWRRKSGIWCLQISRILTAVSSTSMLRWRRLKE